jgi:hypothetical protein
VIRLVVRRCRLALIEISPERIIVHLWGRQGQADLRPFFKKHSLVKQGVEVFLIDRKREVITVKPLVRRQRLFHLVPTTGGVSSGVAVPPDIPARKAGIGKMIPEQPVLLVE